MSTGIGLTRNTRLTFRLLRHYWHRPLLWLAIVSLISHYVRSRLFAGLTEQQRQQLHEEQQLAERWCAERAISLYELERCNNFPFQFSVVDVSKRFVNEFYAATERTKACPVRLGGAANITLIYSLVMGMEARRVLESGVAYGWSSLSILLGLKDMKEGCLVSVDSPYLILSNDDWVGVAVPPTLRTKWHLLRTSDRIGLSWIRRTEKPFDIAHYDSDKTLKGRSFGYRMMWQCLRPGGVLVSDDVGDDLGFKQFCEKVGKVPVIVKWNGKYQGIVWR